MARSISAFPGFRLGINVFQDAEIVGFPAPNGVRPEEFMIADEKRN